MNYPEVLDHLDKLQMHKIKLGLDAMHEFLAKVDHPEQDLSIVHLAGTNGKGTVCAVLAEILGRAGYRVGVYTSPHLSSVRERFTVAGSCIAKEDFARLGTRICEVLGRDVITYFEFTTALGFLWFKEQQPDLVLLETGMGGRLDATNVVRPLASVITSVSMDHEIYLGNSLEEIAAEKAGIIKPKTPVISGAVAEKAAAVIKKKSKEQEAPLYLLHRDFGYELEAKDDWRFWATESLGGKEIKGLRSQSCSLVQQENEALALALLQLCKKQFPVEDAQVMAGIGAVRWPGRMEAISATVHDRIGGKKAIRKEKNYLLDGAHNPAGVDNLARTLRDRFSKGRKIAVWGSMVDKDLATTLLKIAPLFDRIILTQPDGERSATPQQIYDHLPVGKRASAVCVEEVALALARAEDLAEDADLIVVGGSLYLIGAVRALLVGESC